MNVVWAKNGQLFHHLETLALDKVHPIVDPSLEGVYLIWQNVSRRVIYVGSGSILERLSYHRGNPLILQHRGEGMLLVSWAPISDRDNMLRVELFLHDHYKPVASTRAPSTAAPMPVNLPS